MKFLIFISLTLYLAPSYAESNKEDYLFKFDIKSKVYESSDDPCEENSFAVKIIDQVKLECEKKGLTNCWGKQEFIRYDTVTTVSIFKRVDIDSYTYMYLPIPRTIVLGKACEKRVFVRQYSIPKVSEAPKVVSAPVAPLVCKEPSEPNCGLHRITDKYGTYLFSDPMYNEMGARLENGKLVALSDKNIYKGFAGAEVIRIWIEGYNSGFVRLDQTDFPRSCFKTCEEAPVAEKAEIVIPEKKIEVAPKSLAGLCEPLKKDCKIGSTKTSPDALYYGSPDGSDGVSLTTNGGWILELADKNIYKNSQGSKMIKVKGVMDRAGNNVSKEMKGQDFVFMSLAATDYSELCFQTCHDGSVTSNIKNIDNSNRGTAMKPDNKKANDSNKVKKSNTISK